MFCKVSEVYKMSFIFKCPYCGAKTEAEDDWLGMDGECYGCGRIVKITLDGADDGSIFATREIPVMKKKSSPKDNKALLDAVKKISAEDVRNLLDEGYLPGPEKPGLNRNTALHSIASVKVDEQNEPAIMEIIELLIEYGADTEAKNSTGKTPLLVAVSKASLSISRKLLMHGADPNCRDKGGNTPLHVAGRLKKTAEQIRNNIVDVLIEYGADPEAKNRSGKKASDILGRN